MSERLCLRWNDFTENVLNSFGILREVSDFSDVTLVTGDGKMVETHKMVLSMSSPVFQNILKGSLMAVESKEYLQKLQSYSKKLTVSLRMDLYQYLRSDYELFGYDPRRDLLNFKTDAT